MSDTNTESDIISAEGTPTNPLIRLIADLMSNRHRGYAGLRIGGGIHPVPGIGSEHGGKNAEMPQYTDADVIAMLRDGMLAANRDHVLRVIADGPFSGYNLPGHLWTAQQLAFPILGATDTAMPQRIVNYHAARLDVMIKVVNAGNGSIFVGSTENGASPLSGWPMSQGEVITLPTRAEIWATANSTTTQPVISVLTVLREG